MGKFSVFTRGCVAPKSTQNNRKNPSIVAPVSHDDNGIILDFFRSFKSLNDEEKCAWLRSQLIGSDVKLSTPFGTRQITYADYTASGRCLLYVEEFLVKHVMPYYGNTHAEDSFVGAVTTRMVKEATTYIKESMGGTKNDALFFCGSGTTAAVKKLQEVMGITVTSVLRNRMLELLDESHRWVVFIGPYEHHSNILPWRESLAEVVEIPLTSDGLIDMEYLEHELRNPKYVNRPKLGSFSACSNVTGILSDTRRIARILHQHGAFACFDFAAGGPYLKIDMRSGQPDGYDAVFLSPHKYVGGPGTPGLLLMSLELYKLHGNAPSTTGGGVVDFVNFTKADTLYHEDVEAREDAGTPSILQRIKAGLTFMIQDEVGFNLIDSREHYFIGTALKRLSMTPNIVVLGNTRVKRVAILSFLVYTNQSLVLHGRFVAKLLNDLFGIQARGGCSCAGPYGHSLLHVDNNLSLKFRAAIQKGYSGVKPGWTRLNFAYFLSKEEFEFLLCAIEFVAEHGYRFLIMYDFNWQTGDWTFKTEFVDKVLAVRTKASYYNHVLISGNHRQYLETALAIANSLPKERIKKQEVPDYINQELITFGVYDRKPVST